jgi:hypothetical protein
MTDACAFLRPDDRILAGDAFYPGIAIPATLLSLHLGWYRTGGERFALHAYLEGGVAPAHALAKAS